MNPPAVATKYVRKSAGRTFMDSLRVQRKVIHALMVRDAMARFGHENLGFFWVMGEPMVLTCGVMVMWSLAGFKHGEGVGVVPFALTGYTMLTLWRHGTGHFVHFLRRNAGLLFHRNVTPLDVLIARIVLESIGGFAAFCIAYIPFYLIGALDEPNDVLLVIGGWVMMTWLVFGFGLIIAGLSELSEVIEHFIQPVLYLTLPITGMFYMVAWLPPAAQKLVLWSPLANCFEMFRDGVFGNYVQTYWDFPYLLMWCIGVTVVGLYSVLYAKRFVHLE